VTTYTVEAKQEEAVVVAAAAVAGEGPDP